MAVRPTSITVVIGGNTYNLKANDPQSVSTMPAEDRSQLLAILELVKSQQERSSQLAQQALAKRAVAAGGAPPRGATTASRAATTERMGEGDVDALMARLVMEERQQKKSGIKPATIYKIAGVIMAIIVALSVFG